MVIKTKVKKISPDVYEITDSNGISIVEKRPLNESIIVLEKEINEKKIKLEKKRDILKLIESVK
jgi:hypothetical protein